MREVLNGIFYVLSTGCQWLASPKDQPPKSTVHHYFTLRDWDGTLEHIHHARYVAEREQKGQCAALVDLRKIFRNNLIGAVTGAHCGARSYRMMRFVSPKTR